MKIACIGTPHNRPLESGFAYQIALFLDHQHPKQPNNLEMVLESKHALDSHLSLASFSRQSGSKRTPDQKEGLS